MLNELMNKPSTTDSATRWNEWKTNVLSESMRTFKERHPWFHFKKQDIFNNLSEKCHIPQVLYTGAPSGIASTLQHLDHNIVIKKTTGHSSKEVLVLQKTQDQWHCLLTNEKHSCMTLMEWAQGGEVLIEESLGCIEEAIPLDFKCYIANGKAQIIAVINRNTSITTLNYFKSTDLKKIDLSEIFLAPPKAWIQNDTTTSMNLRGRIELAKLEAERIASTNLNCDGLLVSLDMYVQPVPTGYKTWLGEITPRPGALHSNWLKKEFIEDLLSKLE